MEFVKFSAGATGYGTGKEPTEKQEKNVRFNDSKVEETLMKKDDDNEEYKQLHEVLMLLALCHEIVIDPRTNQYNSASPDELALVNAAKQFGLEFKKRDFEDNFVIYDRQKD